MYKTKHVHYKAIFKQDEQTETIEYKAKGLLNENKETQLLFEANGMNIHMTYGENGIFLKQNQSVLFFDYQKEQWNRYQLPYGEVLLKTKLLSFQANEERIKMKYELYDHSGILSTVYIFITMLPYE